MYGSFFMPLLSSADFFFFKNRSGPLSERQTVWIQIRTDTVGCDLGPNCLQRLSADDKSCSY